MIRVAFDFSFPGQYGSGPAPTTGVGRVVLELARELRRREEIELVGVGLHGHDAFPMLTSLRTEAFIGHLNGCKIPVERAFRSRTGLARIYAPRLIDAGKSQLSAAPLEVSRRARFENRVLLKFSNYDCRSGLPSGRFDVFHATFNALPSRGTIPGIGRVQTIFDAIPALFPNDVGPHVTGWFTKVLKSIDQERDVVVAVSQTTKRDFCGITGFEPDRVVVSHLAAGSEFKPCEDPGERAKVRERYGIPGGDFVLCVSNPQPRKNLPFLVRAFFQLATREPSWKGSLVLAGNVACGWGMEQVAAAIASHPEFSHRVIVTKPIADQDLPVLYSECMIFAFPSLYEGFGLPPLEAMACGAPVVCSGSSSLPEVAGAAALMASPSDEGEFSAAMGALVKNAGKRLELGRLGLARAREFSWRATADRVVEAYAMAADRRHG